MDIKDKTVQMRRAVIYLPTYSAEILFVWEIVICSCTGSSVWKIVIVIQADNK